MSFTFAKVVFLLAMLCLVFGTWPQRKWPKPKHLIKRRGQFRDA